jgi:hypothetical protein
MFDFSKVELVMPQEMILLENLENVASYSRIDFYTQIFVQLTFT